MLINIKKILASAERYHGAYRMLHTQVCGLKLKITGTDQNLLPSDLWNIIIGDNLFCYKILTVSILR